MSKKFPTPSVFTTQKISVSRVAIFENGEYICQLRPNEVSSWLHKANISTHKFAKDEAEITITRIKNAIEYLNERKNRNSIHIQLSLF